MGTLIILKEDDEEVKAVDYREQSFDRGVKLRSFHQILMPLALAHSVYNLCLVTLFNFAPLYLVEFRGISLTTAALISMVLPAAGFFSKVSSGFIAEKLGRSKTICVATALSGLFMMSLTQLGKYILALIF
jgi:predicted MFS family arabinose efflux permease